MEVEKITTGDVQIFALAGSLRGWGAGSDFLEEVRTEFASGNKKVVVDLLGVDRIDSSGIGIIASIITASQEANGSLGICAVDPVLQMLGLVRITSVMDVMATREEALASLA